MSGPPLPRLPRNLTGFVFVDIDGDGIRTAGERAVTGALVTITLPDGTRRTVATDADGRYAFTAIAEGRVTIEVLSNGLYRALTVEARATTTRLDVPVAVEPSELAFTGRHSRTELALAALLLVLGTALVTGSGRRRRDSVPR